MLKKQGFKENHSRHKKYKTSVHSLMRNEKREIGLSQKMGRAIMTPM